MGKIHEYVEKQKIEKQKIEKRKIEKQKQGIIDEKEIRECFLRSQSMPRGTAKEILARFYQEDAISLRDLEEIIILPVTAKSIWAALIKNRCLKPSGQPGLSRPTKEFRKLTEQMFEELSEIEEKETRGEMIR